MVNADQDMVCPGCGASISLDDTQCEFCGRKLTFTSTNFAAHKRSVFHDAAKFLNGYQRAVKDSPDDPDVLSGLGFYQFEQGSFAEAAESFDKAIAQGSTDPDVMFHAAIAKFRTDKPFKIPMRRARAIMTQLDGAISMNPSAAYLFAKAQLVRVLFEQRFLKFDCTAKDVMAQAAAAGLSDADRGEINALLGMA